MTLFFRRIDTPQKINYLAKEISFKTPEKNSSTDTRRTFWKIFDQSFIQNTQSTLYNENFQQEISNNIRFPIRTPIKREKELNSLLSIFQYKNQPLKGNSFTWMIL